MKKSLFNYKILCLFFAFAVFIFSFLVFIPNSKAKAEESTFTYVYDSGFQEIACLADASILSSLGIEDFNKSDLYIDSTLCGFRNQFSCSPIDTSYKFYVGQYFSGIELCNYRGRANNNLFYPSLYSSFGGFSGSWIGMTPITLDNTVGNFSFNFSMLLSLNSDSNGYYYNLNFGQAYAFFFPYFNNNERLVRLVQIYCPSNFSNGFISCDIKNDFMDFILFPNFAHENYFKMAQTISPGQGSDCFSFNYKYSSSDSLVLKYVSYTLTNSEYNAPSWSSYSIRYQGQVIPVGSNYSLFQTRVLTPSSYNNGYNAGYEDGYVDGDSAGYERGNEVGFSNGHNQGYSQGYSAGEVHGIATSNQYSFLGLLGAVVDAPLQALSGLLNFDILGFNMANFFYALLTLGIVIFVVKLFLG